MDKKTEQAAELTAEEKALRAEKAAKLQEKRKRYLAAVMLKTGWDKEYARKQMMEARKKVGCSWYVYTYFEFYKMTEEEQVAAYQKWRQKQERRKNIRARKLENSLTEIVNATGWTREHALAMYEDAKARTGCLPDEYCQYRFWELDNKTQESLTMLYHTDRVRSRFNIDVNLKRLIADKSESNKFFAKYIDRKWCSNRGTSFEDFKKTFKGCSKLFYKPMTLFGGHGARPYDLTPANAEEVYNTLMGLPEGVVEEFVVQHPVLQNLSPRVLNTVRLTSISFPGPIDDAGNHFAIPYCMLKMGGATGYVDNLREGGVGAAIDLETGELCTDAVDINLNTYECHPVSGVKVKGTVIPYFDEAKKMIQRIAEENEMKGFLAWDVAITERGPMLIEVNGRPSPLLLELPFYNTPLRGRKHILEPYMPK